MNQRLLGEPSMRLWLNGVIIGSLTTLLVLAGLALVLGWQ